MNTAKLRVTIVQSHLHWENPKGNRALFSEILAPLTNTTDLIVLPEMFTTGFSMNAQKLAEHQDGPTVQWLIRTSKVCNAAITGSVIIQENNAFYNRLFFVKPDGSFTCYDKKHTFTLAGEHAVFTAGTARIVIDYLGFKICPLICYDLRFPVWARNTIGYDVLLYTANWPEKRIAAWDALLKARAIENMSYCIGVNRIGLDGNGHQYLGHSAIYDSLGAQISSPDFEKAFVETITLHKKHIDTTRTQLQFLNDSDRFTLM
ncbi:MAG: omega-amidase [Patiriisocius sp.]|jgi:predicted amidohydrolase